MGLSTSLSNALSGMRTGQSSLDVVSRNIANSGTPGYHRQTLSVVDTLGTNSSYARTGVVQRAFNQSLQVYYTSAVSDAGYADATANVLDRLQTALGKPGQAGSLDTMFGNFEQALQALGTSPDNYATRATVVSQAQAMAQTLNGLTAEVQGLRQDTEAQISTTVDSLNQSVTALAKVNAQLIDSGSDGASRSMLLDQRDRLVEQIAEMVDVRVDYRSDDTVALMTKTGVGILDGKASTFRFESGGAMSADGTSVGKLTLVTASGNSIDLVQQDALQSGRLAALVDLRDNTLVAAQSQLDEIAAGLAQAFSTSTTAGTAASSGSQNGYDLDLGSIRDGNDFTVSYTVNGVEKTLRVVRVDDASKLPMDYTDANGARVLGMDFSGGAADVASKLTSVFGAGFTVSGSGSTLTILDDGTAGTTDVGQMAAHVTASGVQNGDPALSLFVDTGNADFTNSLAGNGQKLGFAGRISVNSAVLNNNNLLVQYQAGGSLGDATRADRMLEQLQSMTFASGETGSGNSGSFRLGGTVGDMIAQTMNYTGSIAERAAADSDTQQTTLDTLSERLDSEYGVNVDEEMARLIQLQNSYAANARVISVVQDLMNRLLEL